VSNVAIVTDSTAAMPQTLVDQYHIAVAPQIVIWDEVTYEDGVDITSEAFYARLATSQSMPTTSQATIASFRKAFEPLVESGRPIAAIVVSDKLSGTYQSAVQAKDMFPDAHIQVFNSLSVAMALGFQVTAAARVAEHGGDLDAVMAAAKQAQKTSGLLIVVDTLDFLHRGGRIGGAAHLFGTALNLKPLLEVEDGRVEPLERVRTKSKALARLLDILESRVGGQRPLRVTIHHTGPAAAAGELEATVRERFSPDEVFNTIIPPAIGVHVGPGAIGVAYSYGL
jgi:fatty acid kinase fatty acid binding subunit